MLTKKTFNSHVQMVVYVKKCVFHKTITLKIVLSMTEMHKMALSFMKSKF